MAVIIGSWKAQCRLAKSRVAGIISGCLMPVVVMVILFGSNSFAGDAWTDSDHPVRKRWNGDRLDWWSLREPRRPFHREHSETASVDRAPAQAAKTGGVGAAVEQLAGDELKQIDPSHPRRVERLVATGYLRLGPWDKFKQFFDNEDAARDELMMDLTNTTGTAFLGQSLACCRCHDHMTDRADLKQRGLLESTLVVWCGEFGRTPMLDVGSGRTRKDAGRNHNIPHSVSGWPAEV